MKKIGRFLSIFIVFSLFLFSSLKAEEDYALSFVNRLYKHVLNREADKEGALYWSSLLKEGRSASEIAKEFFRSEEFLNSGVSDREYVKRLYRVFLDREPDNEGLEYWTKMLEENRVKRDQIFYNFVFSREFSLLSLEYKIRAYDQKDKLYSFIERFYELILDRVPSPSEVEYWYENLKEGKMTPKFVAGGFLYSEEFLKKRLNNEEFVSVLYQAVMNRVAEEEGLRFWSDKLNGRKISKNEVVDYFLNSKEFKDLYESYLNFNDFLKSLKGLNLEIGSFSLRDEEGREFVFQRSEISLLPNEEQYIYVDLATKKVHRFKHCYHDGGILLGFVKTDENSTSNIIPIDPSLPQTGIKKFLKKLYSGEKVKVAVLGDSLFRPDTGEGNRWLDRLFDQNNEDKTFLLPSNVSVENFSVGGETPMWGAAQLSLSVLTSGFIDDDGEVYSARVGRISSLYYKEINKDLYKPSKFDELLTKDFDLYVVGLGVNLGISYQDIDFLYAKEFFEMMIRRLIRSGKEVVIMTESNNAKIHNYHTDVTDWQIEIAKKYGCGLANSWDYTYEAAKEGEDIWTPDTIHMNDKGQVLYANALYSVFTDLSLKEKPKGYDKVFMDESFPSAMESIFYTPDIGDEAKYLDYILSDGAENLYSPKRHGYEKVCELQPGAWAVFYHPFSKGAALLIQTRHPFKAEVRDENGKLIKEIEVKEEFLSFHTIPILIPIDLREGDFSSHAWRIESLTGTMRIYALIALTKELEEIGFEDVNKIGEGWGYEDNVTSFYQVPRILYTDNIGDELEIEYEGRALNILIAKGESGGIIEIYEDGKLLERKDLYFFDPYSSYGENRVISLTVGDYKRKSLLHKVKIRLYDKNEYARTPSKGSHRVMIYEINKILD